MKQGVGVRAWGWAGRYSAVANDASAVFYNPAGLAETGLDYTYGNLDTQQQIGHFYLHPLKLGFFGYVEGRVTNPATQN